MEKEDGGGYRVGEKDQIEEIGQENNGDLDMKTNL